MCAIKWLFPIIFNNHIFEKCNWKILCMCIFFLLFQEYVLTSDKCCPVQRVDFKDLSSKFCKNEDFRLCAHNFYQMAEKNFLKF